MNNKNKRYIGKVKFINKAQEIAGSPQKEDYPHFRLYLKANHPALITAEHSHDEYKYRKVTHSETDGGRKNEKISPNPNPKDNKPMYIGKRIRHDKKKNFSKWKYSWKYFKK